MVKIRWNDPCLQWKKLWTNCRHYKMYELLTNNIIENVRRMKDFFLQAKDLTCEKQWNHITLTSSKSIKPLPSVSLNWVNCSRSLATQSGSDYDSGSIVRWAKSNEKVDTMVPILSSLIPVHVPNVFINIDLKEEKISTKTSRSILTCPSPSLSMSSRVSWTTMSLMCSASSGWRKAENSWNSILT